MAALNCTAQAGEFYRRRYPGTVVRGFHCPPVQQPYCNCFLWAGSVLDVRERADHSDAAVVGKLPKHKQKRLLEK